MRIIQKISQIILLFSLVVWLSACGNDGVDDVPTIGGETVDETISDSKPRITAFWSGEAFGGLTVNLNASGEDNGEIVEWRWVQTVGPSVLLQNAESSNARFYVPAFKEDRELRFTVTATDDDGNWSSHELSIILEALNLQDLRPIDPQIAEEFVVFRADKDLNDRIDLYLATLDGTRVYRLNTPLVPNGDVGSFRISPNLRYVAYRADQDTDGVHELYVAAADSSGVHKVNLPLASSNVSSDFELSADSQYIAYRAIQNEAFELFANNPNGSASHRLSGDLVAGGSVQQFKWRPDGKQISYLADQFTDNTLELFVSNADGSSNHRVSGVMAPGANVNSDFTWSPDCCYIAYRADQLQDGIMELFVSKADGSSNYQVSLPPVLNGDVLSYAWSPDSEHLAYLGDVVFDGVQELYSVRRDGSENTRVAAIPPGGDVTNFKWSPDGSKISYQADQITDNQVELFVSGVDGSANHVVSGLFVSGGQLVSHNWSPDGMLLSYVARQDDPVLPELYVSAADASFNLKVSEPLGAGGAVGSGFQWSPDSTWLAYRSRIASGDPIHLYSTTADGAVGARVSGPMTGGGNVIANSGNETFAWYSDSKMLLYLADQLVDDRFELFVAAPDGGIINASLSGELANGGDVLNFNVE